MIDVQSVTEASLALVRECLPTVKVNTIAEDEARNPNLSPSTDGSLQCPRKWAKIACERFD